jgi:ABC-2 type transport system ATP-binding protein
MIEVKGLSKRYGDRLAVDKISFTAKPGEIVGLLGPNGAGKTTTMRMLTGYMPPTEGTASIAGFDILEESLEARKHVGYLPERVPLYPDMTVRGYITFWAQLRGLRHPGKHVDAALERVHLTDRQNQLLRNLSKGLRQRLGLAQALVHDPPVIILDEPTIGIDPQQVIEVRETVRSLGEKHTVLFSTHILSEAEQVCDRVLIINKGRIVAQGKPADLRRQFETKTQLYVVVGGATEKETRRLFKDIPGVESVEREGDGFHVSVSGARDIRGEISSRVMKAGYTLLEIRQATSSLEEIFLEVVGKSK